MSRHMQRKWERAYRQRVANDRRARRDEKNKPKLTNAQRCKRYRERKKLEAAQRVDYGASTSSILTQMATSENTFPTTLQGFGYAFNKDGQLRKIDPLTKEAGDEPFQFNVSEDSSYNQRHYEAIGEVITEHVYELLETDVKLHKLMVPKDGPYEKRTFIFVTSDVLINPNKMLILIHGSGVVRAGQWARSLIINDSLKTGTQIPYINRARELGYAVVVLNTNDNTKEVGGKTITVKNSGDPKEHLKYVWKTYLKDAKARHVAIVAHSYGGVCAVDWANQQFSDFSKRVFAVAMTDSVHSMLSQKVSSKVQSYLRKIGRNWVSEDTPLDESVYTPDHEIQRMSAGHPKHEMTSASAMESVFSFLENRYAAVTGKQDL